MATEIPVLIGQGVEDRLKHATLEPRNYTVERSYGDWSYELEDLEGLQLQEEEKLRIDIVVQSSEVKVKRETRGMETYTVPVDVCVRKKFGDSDKSGSRVKVESVDELVGLVYGIRREFRDCKLVNHGDAVLDETQQDGPIVILYCPVAEHLAEMRQFTGILRLFFVAHEQINATASAA